MANSGIKVDCANAVEAAKQFKARKLRAFVLKFDSPIVPGKTWNPSKVMLDCTLEATKDDVTEENSVWNQLSFSDDYPAYYICWFRKGKNDGESAKADDEAVLLWWSSDEMPVKKKMLASSTLSAVKQFLKKNSLDNLPECRIGGKDELKTIHVYKAVLDRKKEFGAGVTAFEGVPMCELKKK